MTVEKSSGPGFIFKAIGYLAAWTVLTLALTVASRSIHLGPGFKNPLPYAAAAMAMNQAGRLLRRWLGEGGRPLPESKGIWGGLRAGFSFFLRDTSAFNNFLLLSLAYFLGTGASALFTRFSRKTPSATDSYWVDSDLGKKERDAYYRPY
jgi:hypothetical protein